MTERLYYTDAYRTRFDARVVEVVDGDQRRVYLDRTAFYPTSGGQPHDIGRLGSVTVSDVIDEGDRIAHIVDASVVEEHVRGEIDWVRRFDNMQQHTGQHILSAIFAESLGAKTLSVHFGAQYSTLDLDVERLTAEALAAVEQRANEVVWENRTVTVSFEDAANAAVLRKPSARGGQLRIVTVDGLDRSACGGTHVRGTSEIGVVLLRRTDRVKKALRVEFLCGARAVGRSRAEFGQLARMAQTASASIDDLGAVFDSQAAALRDAESARRRLAEALDRYRARELYAAAQADALGIRRALQRCPPGTTLEDVRGLALALAALPRVIYVAASEAPPALLVAASDDSGANAGELLRAAVTPLGGRGGGSARLAQGSLPTTQALQAALAALAGSTTSSVPDVV